MVLKVEPLVRAVENIEARFGKCSVIYFSPAGRSINQDLIGELSAKKRHTILICGHYEGVDQRFIDHWVDYEVSLGDFVMTGGEIAAIALVDALIRHIPGTLGEPESVENESFKLQDPKTGQRLLEYPQYTRPAEFQKLRVPEALLSGHHDEIRRWRMDRARERTNRTTKIDKIGTRRDT